MDEILKDYLTEKRKNIGKVVLIEDEKHYYTFKQDGIIILNVITMLKTKITYKTITGGIIIDSDLSLLNSILNKLNIEFIVLESTKSMKKLYNKYLNYNDQMINKCENCKYFKNGDCYGIEITKKCKDFKKVNSFKKGILNNIKADYSSNKSDGFLLLGSYCKG